jgi:hypothetical protein
MTITIGEFLDQLELDSYRRPSPLIDELLNEFKGEEQFNGSDPVPESLLSKSVKVRTIFRAWNRILVNAFRNAPPQRPEPRPDEILIIQC